MVKIPASPMERLSLEAIRHLDVALDLAAGPRHPASTLKPGTTSANQIAVAGEAGYMFIANGANQWERQYAGDMPVPPAWIEGWVKVIDNRRSTAAARGVMLRQMVVPEKQAVYFERRWPNVADPGAKRPLRILQANLPGDALLYPDAELRAEKSRAPTYFRHNSHWTPSGCLVALGTILAGVAPAMTLNSITFACARETLQQDLSAHMFEPAPFEERLTLVPAGEVFLDNKQYETTGRVTGSSYGVRNPAAPDPRKLILFGDSYAYDEGLSAALSAVFSEVVFIWSKAVLWDQVTAFGSEVVIWQTAERFLATLPQS